MNGPAVIPDEAPRTRIRVALGESLFVDAGAGSGKTTALVGRVVELVRSGIPMSEIAAITFTEAAAAELRHRLRSSLRDAAARSSDLFEQQTFTRALEELDGAAIHTLHAFAQRILRRFPVEAGLPPSVEVADEIESVVRFVDRWRAFIDEWESDARWQPAFRRFFHIGGSEQQLAELARTFNDHWDRLPADELVDPPELVRVDISGILGPLNDALQLADRCTSTEDLLLRHLTHVVAPFRDVLLAAVDDDERLRVLAPDAKLTTTRGKPQLWEGAKPAVLEHLSAAQAERERVFGVARDQVVGALKERVSAFVVHAADRRRRRGLLEFHDLLVLARDLLRDHPEVRRALHQSSRALLLDEFQDTDPLQLDLARSIALGENPDGSVEVPPGRLFFVGDPKQSIYRFRRADLSIYLETRATFAAGLCELSANFRTVPGIIEWVNRVFSRLMDQADGQAPYLPLAPVRAPLTDGRPPVIVAGGALEETAGEVRRLSAEDLAAVLRRMVDEAWAVLEPGTDVERPVRFDDICVLVPSRLAVPALEEAFGRAGLPYRLLTSSLIWAAQEVREVVSILRAVDDPGDEVHLVAALRSPMFACSDSDLFEWRTSGGRWSYLFTDHPSLPPDHPVAEALSTLARLHHDRWWLGPDGLVDRLLTDHGVLELAALAGRRRDRWRRLRFLADQAQAFVESQRGDLTSFLRWVELQSSDTVRVSSPVLPEDDDPAVRVMTIHGSKGLEFPVVALFGLGVTTRGRAASVLWSDDNPEVRFSKDLASLGYDDLRAAEEQMDRAERIRLLYVGATRARDRLVVCTHHKATKTPSSALGALFDSAMEAVGADLDPTVAERWLREPVPSAPDDTPALPLSLPDPDSAPVLAERAAREEWIRGRRALIEQQPRLVWSATAVAKAASPDALDTDAAADEVAAIEDEAGGVTWRRGRAGTAIGRAVHGTLQLVDLGTRVGLDAIARAQAGAEGVEAHVDTVAALARAAAASSLIGELVEREHWREMYVAAPIGGVTVEGYVDLLADDGAGGLVVVDYKTDSVHGSAEVSARTERYRLQAATYALALEAVTGRQVTRAVFLFLGRAGAIESEVEDLDAAKADALAVLDASGPQ